MDIHFWGARGTIPSPGKETVRFGGNTSCISVDLDASTTLILDAGSGIRMLGSEQADQKEHFILLISHVHWDHIQGLPFFRPLLMANRTITLPDNYHTDWVQRLLAQIDGVYFPLTLEQIPCKLNIISEDLLSVFAPFGLKVSTIQTNHPGGCLGYRMERAGHAVIYMPDNELYPPGVKTTEFDEFVAFCRGADILIHDAQYTTNEMPQKHGWGHSVVDQVCALAAAADVERLVLFHHDPTRHDEAVEAIQHDARAALAELNPGVTCLAAYDGLKMSC